MTQKAEAPSESFHRQGDHNCQDDETIVHVTIILSDEGERSLTSASSPEDTQEPAATILRAVDNLGYRLSPVHPGVGDPALRTHFFVEVPDPTAAEAVISSLKPLHDVKGVYVKPAEELP